MLCHTVLHLPELKWSLIEDWHLIGPNGNLQHQIALFPGFRASDVNLSALPKGISWISWALKHSQIRWNKASDQVIGFAFAWKIVVLCLSHGNETLLPLFSFTVCPSFCPFLSLSNTHNSQTQTSIGHSSMWTWSWGLQPCNLYPALNGSVLLCVKLAECSRASLMCDTKPHVHIRADGIWMGFIKSEDKV